MKIISKQSIQRPDRDLLILVIAEVFVYIITTTLFLLIHLETMISQYVLPTKSLQYIQYLVHYPLRFLQTVIFLPFILFCN